MKILEELNADASNTPHAFQSLAADSEIEFCLLQDPMEILQWYH